MTPCQLTDLENVDLERKGGNIFEQNASYSYSSFGETSRSVLTNTALNHLEAQPSFIPQFPDLRKKSLQNTEDKLRNIERDLYNLRDPEKVSKKLDEATALLKLLGKCIPVFLGSVFEGGSLISSFLP